MGSQTGEVLGFEEKWAESAVNEVIWREVMSEWTDERRGCMANKDGGMGRVGGKFASVVWREIWVDRLVNNTGRGMGI